MSKLARSQVTTKMSEVAMHYSELKDFIENKMRMSHIYQPVMIKALIDAKGALPTDKIASKFLEYDTSQIEYYEQITKNMPGRVLARHDVVRKDGSNYVLNIDVESLTSGQREELISLCDTKINEYIGPRGPKIWQHRRLSDRNIPGSVRYNVLTRAGYRCELCGVSADERKLEVDHIIPRNLQGPSEENNYQALCYKCNANKRDTDSTDFRDWKHIYDKKEVGCIFCEPEAQRILANTGLAYVLKDGFPVTDGHILVIPTRHIGSFFELYSPEQKACMRLLNEWQSYIKANDSSVKGFNIGVNVNEAAGQTIGHCHIHLIPRRYGDVSEPRGGIRNVIPGKGNYNA
jgi:diadenosine tetraphosphate (Ap4A) HIT family hydrolase